MPWRVLSNGGHVGCHKNPSIHIQRPIGYATRWQLTRNFFLCQPYRRRSNPNLSLRAWGPNVFSRLHVWRLATEALIALNGLHVGRCDTETPVCDVNGASSDVVVPWALAHKSLLTEAASLHRARRNSGLTDATAVDEILSKSNANSYSRSSPSISQVPLVADAIDEPSGDHAIELLEALDPSEALFYSQEDQFVDPFRKSTTHFKDIEAHYGFIGGDHDQYLNYFYRTDLPKDYCFLGVLNGKRMSNRSPDLAVPKKDPSKQRKLLMSCATNYWWCDVRRRASHGLWGAGALSALHAPGDSWAVSAFDESNAFSWVRTPRWMWAWFAAPPLRAVELWDILPLALRADVD